MIRVEGLRFQHRGSPEPALRGVSLHVAEGEVAALLGPNGSGKTTLFQCLAGLWRPEGGSVRLGGAEVRALSPRERARRVAVVPQNHAPAFPYTVLDAVLMGRAAHLGPLSAPCRRDRELAEQALAAVGVTQLGGRVYTRLSGGERQLVLIARALAQEAPVLLLDEPTSHLDFRNQFLVLERVREIAAERRLTVLMTLHDPNLALGFARRVILLRAGAVAAAGPVDEVLVEANLSKLYGFPVRVVEADGRRVVCAGGGNRRGPL